MGEIDTTNEYLVGAQGDRVVVVMPPRGPMTKEQALRLAVYLRVLSGATDAEYDAMHNAVVST